MPALPVPRGGGISSAARPVDSVTRYQASGRWYASGVATDRSSWFDSSQRRDPAALHRDVDFQVDVDSQGGEISRPEIGRLMRAEGASIVLGTGASCVSACVFLLMGAIERHISGDARVGIHRPSLRAPPEGGPRQASEDAIVAAMSEQLVLYAQQMHVSRTIIDALMVIPPDRVELLSVSALATYGITARDAVALEERRARSQSLLHPGTAQGR